MKNQEVWFTALIPSLLTHVLISALDHTSFLHHYLDPYILLTSFHSSLLPASLQRMPASDFHSGAWGLNTKKIHLAICTVTKNVYCWHSIFFFLEKFLQGAQCYNTHTGVMRLHYNQHFTVNRIDRTFLQYINCKIPLWVIKGLTSYSWLDKKMF